MDTNSKKTYPSIHTCRITSFSL